MCNMLHLGTPGKMIQEAEMAEQSRYHFKSFVDRTIELEIMSICRLLGHYGNLNILVDHFMDLFVQSAMYRKQAAYCLKEILAGVNSPPAFVQQSVSKHVYETDELDSMVRYATG
jgi:hypothetical protein